MGKISRISLGTVGGILSIEFISVKEGHTLLIIIFYSGMQSLAWNSLLFIENFTDLMGTIKIDCHWLINLDDFLFVYSLT